jgi:hypothetical protein
MSGCCVAVISGAVGGLERFAGLSPTNLPKMPVRRFV